MKRWLNFCSCAIQTHDSLPLPLGTTGLWLSKVVNLKLIVIAPNIRSIIVVACMGLLYMHHIHCSSNYTPQSQRHGFKRH